MLPPSVPTPRSKVQFSPPRNSEVARSCEQTENTSIPNILSSSSLSFRVESAETAINELPAIDTVLAATTLPPPTPQANLQSIKQSPIGDTPRVSLITPTKKVGRPRTRPIPEPQGPPILVPFDRPVKEVQAVTIFGNLYLPIGDPMFVQDLIKGLGKVKTMRDFTRRKLGKRFMAKISADPEVIPKPHKIRTEYVIVLHDPTLTSANIVPESSSTV